MRVRVELFDNFEELPNKSTLTLNGFLLVGFSFVGTSQWIQKLLR